LCEGIDGGELEEAKMNNEQKFGSVWTIQKLDAVENYLRFFTTALKQKSFKLCYIDAFSGSGKVTLKGGQIVEGSALRALKYPFDQFYFFDMDAKYCQALSEKVRTAYPEKQGIVKITNGDCNRFLQRIDQHPWRNDNWRGVIFLDPCAMQLSWSCLETISNTKAFDVWYLFPFSAVNRNLPKSGVIRQPNEELLTKIFGSADWKEHIYQESPQISMFDEPDLQKVPNGLKEYIQNRLSETFPTVTPNSAILRNEKNSPIFLLCFAGSNPSSAAKELSLKGAKYILDHIGDE
jgi:three-Cys-motif partner protein